MATNKSLEFAWWEKILLALIPPVIAWLMTLLNRSCRVVKHEGLERQQEVAAQHGGRAVYCGWHQRMFYHFYVFGRLHVTMMISRSKDGEWADRVAHCFGFKSVRGSTRKRDIDKGGATARDLLIEKVKEGESAGMMLDGPRGPAREVKMGSITIAQKTGAPLIGQMWGCDRAWVLNSWDRFMIPKPFAKLFLLHLEPRFIPPDATPEELEEIRRDFGRELDEAAKRCDDYFGVQRPLKKEQPSKEQSQ